MAISWGPWVANSRWRIGTEMKYSGTPSTGTLSVTIDVWFQVQYASSEHGQSGTKWSVSGDLGSAGAGFDWNLGNSGTKKLGSRTANVSLTYGATKKVSASASVTVAYTYPGSSTKSDSITLPARPFNAPAAPSGVTLTASREALTAKWTNNSTTAAPYSSVEFETSSDGGSTYSGLTSLSSGTTSRAFNGAANRNYRIRVRAKGAGGTSGWAYSGTTWTTRLPTTPTSATLVRGASEALNASWVRASGEPYDSQELQWMNSRDNTWYNGSTSISGTATTFSSTGGTNLKYRFRIRAKNTAGYSGWRESGWQSTTPAAPATPSATKDASGDILVGYSAPAAGSSSTQYEVWHAANGVWDGARLALVTAANGSYRHAAPNPAQTHKYRLRAVSASPTLYSSYSGESTTVQLQTPPNAPTNLGPLGTQSLEVTLDSGFNLTWKHNPKDSTPQRQFRMRMRVGTGAWKETAIVSWANELANVKTQLDRAGLVPNGGDVIEWQVQTWGAHADPSPYSAGATFKVSSTPEASVSYPTDEPVPTSRLTGQWGYTQAEGSPQAQWRAKLIDANGKTLETKTGSNTATSVTFDRIIKDATEYTLSVEVRSAEGIWSAPALQTFPVAYPLPPVPQLTPVWDPADGSMTLEVYVEDPLEDEEVEATSVNVYRTVGDSEDWVPVAMGVDPRTSVVDPIPPLGALIRYKATALSDLPSSIESEPVEAVTQDAWAVFLNGGTGFVQGVKLSTNMVADGTFTPQKELIDFGRPSGLPTEFSGNGRSNGWKLSSEQWALWHDDSGDYFSPWGEVRDLVMLPGPHCMRFPDGTKVFVSLMSMGASDLFGSTLGVQIDIQELDYSEDRAFIEEEEE